MPQPVRRPIARVHFVCPNNGERAFCPICQCPMPHRREEWAWPNARPVCETHRAPLEVR
jgi:hypothetical protein